MRAFLLCLVFAAPQPSPEPPASRTYRSAVERYKAGQPAQAIETLIVLGRDAINESSEALAARKRIEIDTRTAAMLHTDTGEVLWRIDRALALAHIDRARAWAMHPRITRLIFDAAGTLRRAFCSSRSGQRRDTSTRPSFTSSAPVERCRMTCQS